MAWRPVLVVALALLILLLATASDYGFHRDELYFLEAGKHPAFGYDDQPPLTPLIGRVATAVFGETPWALRLPSALAIVACVFLTALMARELGGETRAQVVASAAVAASGLMFAGHLLSTATFDILVWALALYLVTRLLAREDRRLWLALGVVVGVGLLNKHLVLLLVASLLGGALVARRYDLLRSRMALGAAAIALVLWAPNIIWQASHGWPQETLAGQISNEDPWGYRAEFVPLQVLFVGPLLAPVWIAGLLWLLRDREADRFRLLGFGYLVLVALCLLSAAKAYYAAAYYVLLLAAGGVALEKWLAIRSRRLLMAGAVALTATVSAFLTLPLIPARDLADTPVADVNEDAIETIGWPALAQQVASVYQGLPEAEQRHAVIFTANYGEAGALRHYRASFGLPPAFSGHNSFTSFGTPPDGARPIVVVGLGRAYLSRFFEDCRLASRVDNHLGIDNEEQNAPIWICSDTQRPWSQLWSSLHHLDA
jgi:4-amino-4-deoxy-L-arabinose transferase-like glycosyltransferase